MITVEPIFQNPNIGTWNDIDAYPDRILVTRELPEDYSKFFDDGVYYVPEKTCRNEARGYNHGNFRCSECGYRAWACNECYSNPEDHWSFCPNCGAKVIEESEEKQ